MPAALLDTDMLSELLKLRNPTVRENALAYSRLHGALAFSSITRYEILRGYKQRGATRQLALFHTFCQQSVIFPVTDEVLDRASDLWAMASQKGHPRNDVDLMIAATALAQGRILITGNTSHFSWIPDLALENWRLPQQ